MIRSLRKKHVRVWILWLVLLPTGMASAILMRKAWPVSHLDRVSSGNLLPDVIWKKHLDGALVEVRSGKGQIQLAWKIVEPLQVPSVAVYLAPADKSDLESSRYLGRIE